MLGLKIFYVRKVAPGGRHDLQLLCTVRMIDVLGKYVSFDNEEPSVSKQLPSICFIRIYCMLCQIRTVFIFMYSMESTLLTTTTLHSRSSRFVWHCSYANVPRPLQWRHNDYGSVPITSLTVVYSTVYSDADQRIHQSSASLAFVRGIHRKPVNSPHKWPVTRKMFPFDDIIMLGHW